MRWSAQAVEDLNWKAHYLRGQFLKTDVAVQEWAQGTWHEVWISATNWLAGWLADMNGQKAVSLASHCSANDAAA
jgi:hypothetical protein